MPVPDNAVAPAPTHLLRGAFAHALNSDGTELAEGWHLYRSKRGWQLRGSGPPALVNGNHWQPEQVLHGGDRIAIGSAPEIQLITVQP